MDTTAVFVIVLAIAVLGTECYSPPERPPPARLDPSARCYQRIDQCTRSLQQNSFISGVTTDYRVLITNIDQLCEDYQSAKACIERSPNTCQNDQVQIFTEMAFNVGDYVCSAHGKSLLREIQNSVCFENPLIIFEIEGVAQRCYFVILQQEGREVSNDFCVTIQEISRCTSDWIRDTCGNALGDFVSGILTRIEPALTGQDCWDNETVVHLKRASFLFKRSVSTDQ